MRRSIGERSHLGRRLEAIADDHRASFLGKGVDERLVDAFLDIEARRRSADLTRVARLSFGRHHGRGDWIDVIADDDRRMSSELHEDGLHVVSGEPGEAFSDRGGSGEGDEPDLRLRNQIFGYLGRNTEDEIHHAWGQAGIMKRAGDVHRTSGRFLRRLHDDRTACCECARDFARRLTQRKVPGRERSHHADRLVMNDVLDSRFARDHAAIDSLAFGSIPLEELATADDFQSRLRERLAMFERDRTSDFIGPLTHQRSGLEHDLGTLPRRESAPHFESAAAACERVVQIRARCDRNLTDDGLGRRIQYGLRGGRFLPGATDIEMKIRIFRHG